jgi:Ca-activated chloride channel family protein
MSFGWPLALLGLLIPLALVAAYVLGQRRRRRHVVRYSSIGLVRTASPRRAGWKRHLPVALVTAALAALALGAARPQFSATVPRTGSTVILALDVSGSMCSTDVRPNRLAAAQAAVRGFVEDQAKGTKIGLVVFSGFAQLAVAPTTDTDELVQAIDTVTTGRGTTIGSAILTSIDAIAALDPGVAPSDPVTGGVEESPPGSTPSPAPSTPGPSSSGGAPAKQAPEIVVLLTDGANTRGVTPEVAAQQAAARGVRVYTIGFGTTNPAPLTCSSSQLGGDMFNGFGNGGRIRGGMGALVVDEDALRSVARTTGAAYFNATDAGQLKQVFAQLPSHVDLVRKEVEASVALVALALLLLLGAGFAAARWSAFPS